MPAHGTSCSAFVSRCELRFVATFAAAVLALAVDVCAAQPSTAVPSRIVSLAPSVTETLFALDEGQRLVGATTYCDWPPAARAVPRVGSYLEPSVEAVVAAEPDLVIAVPSPGNHKAVDALTRLGIEVLIVEEGPTLADLVRTFRTMAAAVGQPEKGEALVRELESEIDAVRERVAGRPAPGVLVVVGREPMVAAGRGSLIDDIVRLAGGRNLAAPLGKWPRTSLEWVIRSNPTVILDSSMGSEDPAGEKFYRDLGLDAALQGRVHAILFDELLRPGPRIAKGLRIVAERLHPEAFAEGAPPPRALVP